MPVRLRRTFGFALIELLPAVAIIALPVAIPLPSLARARESTKSAACASHLRTFGSAFEIDSAKHVNNANVAADRIAVMGDSRAGDSVG